MDKLGGIVIGEVTKQILQPEHLVGLLGDYPHIALEREDRNRARLRQMRHDQKAAEAGITRLPGLVERGLMDAEGASMRERLVNLRFPEMNLPTKVPISPAALPWSSR